MAEEITDRDIRREVQKLGWFFANSTERGPAHIVTERLGRNNGFTLCGANIDTRLYRRATKMCKRCRKIAANKFVSYEIKL